MLLPGTANIANAQPVVACDPCAGQPWGPEITSTFMFTLPQPAPPCQFRGYVTYRTRPCMGKVQVEVISFVYENTMGPGCATACIHGGSIMKQLYVHLLSLVGAPILRSLPSPCYYTGTITVPPAAEICFGMTPGSERKVLVPCDENGCCQSELTAAPGSYYQNVLYATACPAVPVIPPSSTIKWSCDILGGGSATFVVPFTPDMPIVCQIICGQGIALKQATGVDEEFKASTIKALDIYPNPVGDAVKISFNTEKEGMDVNVEIFDISGKVLVREQTKTTGGSQIISINTSELINGNYGLRMTYGEERIVTKITK
jgi:hypothetical protein